MGFRNLREYKQKVIDGGQAHSSTFRKTTTTAAGVGSWFDGSTMFGHPVTNFYASTPLKGEYLLGREGIQTGPSVSPAKKYLKRVTAMCTVAPINLLLTDTLLYYPFIDGDSTDEQFLDNTNPITRATTGQGLNVYMVSQGAFTGGAEFFINYTNQNGVSGRLSKICKSNVAAIAGTVISSGATGGVFNNTWFIPLADGDTGLRSVESVTFLTANGGIFALVICCDLGTLSIREANVPAEKDYFLDTGFNMPVIEDNSYLSFLVLPNASIASAPIYGSIQTVWG